MKNKRMRNMLIITAVVFAVIVGGRYFNQMMMGMWFAQMGEARERISASEARHMDWARHISAVGTARAVNGTHLSMEAAGIVESIHFASGDEVQAGDVLLRLDAGADQAELTSLRAGAELARLELERTQRLHDQGSTSRAELDRARSQADQARGRAEAQAARVAQKTLRAPFAGRLGIRQVDQGEYLAPGTPVVNLQQLNPIHVEFSLPEQRLADIDTGYPVIGTIDAHPDLTFEGEVNAMEPSVRESSRNFRVQAVFENDDQILRPGMFVRVRIEQPGETQVLAIPQTAVSFAPYGNSVWVISEEGEGDESRQVVNRRLIRTGERRGDFIAVLEGLEAGERIASSGLLKLSSGMAVEIDNANAPEAELDPRPGN